MAYNSETKKYEGFIYKIWNDVNNIIYIGRTWRTIKKRWKEHCNYSEYKNTDLYNSMRKIGIVHFNISVVEFLTSDTYDEIKSLCFDRERYWISIYKENNVKLYNMTDGGDDVLEKKFPEQAVIQYDLFCNELNRFRSITEAANITGITGSDISTCCSKKGKIYRTAIYIWRYENDPLSETEINELHERYKGVKQYDFNGNLLNTFYLPSEAAEYMSLNGINVSVSNILACMNGTAKSCCNFVWRYRMDQFDKYPLPKRPQIVNQFSLDGKYIGSFNNCADAARETNTNCSSINQCCLGKNKTAGGFIWRYEEESIQQ